MALDGGFIYKLAQELNSAVGAHVEKIYQPTKDELVFLLRSASFSKRLLISARQGTARIHYTEARLENPPTPPVFCMLLRKFFGSAKIVEISTTGLERTLKITASSLNEMGDVIYPCIYVELIGAAPNIIAVDQNGRIIDAVRRSNIENGGRLIHPGAIYEPPTRLNRLNILNTDIDLICEKILDQVGKLDKAILNTIEGFSPLICREIAFSLSGNTEISVGDLTKLQKEHLKTKLVSIRQEIIDGGAPTLVLNEENEPVEFCYIDIFQYGKTYKTQKADTYCQLLETFYGDRAYSDTLKKESQDLFKLLTNLEARILRRKNEREKDLKACERKEEKRIFGELLKANLYNITSGQTFAEVQNYYDESLSMIRIPLNPALSPANNAAKYFKDYKKLHTAEQTLLALIEADKKELEYIYSVLDSLSRCENLGDIADIRDELASCLYIHHPKSTKKKKDNATFKECVSPSGFKVLIGKNNRQNDLLTTCVATKSNLWFHVKNIPGSHVILCCDSNNVADEDIVFAARQAAKHSKAAASSNVAVDYTPVKFVKKPNGAKPGMVIYSTNKTVFVDPQE
ncbi:MAG: NFACT family protein [Clostridia bacterium]|nr:NFACT family protein [Clostridia bacterium]